MSNQSTLQTISSADLADITGGAIRAAGGSTTAQTQMQMQAMTTQLATLSQNNNNNNSNSFMPIMFAAMMSRA